MFGGWACRKRKSSKSVHRVAAERQTQDSTDNIPLPKMPNSLDFRNAFLFPIALKKTEVQKITQFKTFSSRNSNPATQPELKK
jgi:hypothetical protein